MFPIFTEGTARQVKVKLQEIEGDQLLVCWDEMTGFLYCAHCINGSPIYLEVCGPINERQAKQTADSMGLELGGTRAIFQA